MALTKVGPAGIGSTPGNGYTIGDSFLHPTGLDATNAKFTGIVTAQTFRVLGNFQVDGTTTTLDTEVTSVDKLEVAANNTTVGVAITQSGSGDILNLYDSGTEVFSVTDGGNVKIGTTTEGNANADNLTVADSANSGITIRSGTSNIGSIFFSDATSGGGEYAGFIDYNHSSNQMSFGTAENTRLTLKSNGNVSIGTATDSTQKLGVYGTNAAVITQNAATGTGANNGFYMGNSNSTIAYLWNYENNAIIIATNDTERIRISAGGFVGIGTNNPLTGLDVVRSGDNIVSRFSNGTRGLEIAATSTGGALQTYNANQSIDIKTYSTSNSHIAFSTNNTERLRITPGGQVLVGNYATHSSIHGNLEVNGNDGINISNATRTGTNGAQWRLIPHNGGGSATNLRLYEGAGATEVINITKDGNIGISRTNPSYRLHVHTVATNTTQVTGLAIANDASGVATGAKINLGAGNGFDSTSAGISGWYDGTGTSLSLFTAASYASTNHVERLRINSAGQMILGTASNLGSSPPKLTIVNNTNSFHFSECQLLRLNGPSGVGERGGIGFHYAQSLDHGEKPSSFIGVETVAAGGAQQTDLLFATRPNTTDSEPTERLRITSGGDLGLGDTNPDSSYGTNLSVHSTATDGARLKLSDGTTGKGASDGLDIISTGGIAYFIQRENANMQFYTNNTERLRIKSDGNIGIGDDRSAYPIDLQSTTSPLTLNLKLNKGSTTGDYAEIAFQLWNGAGTGANTFGGSGTSRPSVVLRAVNEYTNTAAGAFVVATWPGGTNNSNLLERLRVTSAGRVGINETSPDTKLHVRNDNSAALKVGGDGGGGYYLEIGQLGTSSSPGFNATGTSTSMLFRLNGTEAMRLNPSGHMGIGTNSPTQILELKTGEPRLCLNSTDANSSKGIEFEHNGGRMGHLFHNATSGEMSLSVGENTAGAHYLTFKSGDGTEKMRLASNGELLIGETSSGGTCRLGMSFGNAIGNYIEMGGTSRTANGLSKLAVMRHGYWGGSKEVASIGFITSSSSGGAGRGTGNFVVHTGTSGNGDGGNTGDNLSIERIRVDSEGRFYVNTSSPNNWSQQSNSLNKDKDNGANPSGNMCFRTSEGALVIANDADSGYSAVYINKYEWASGDDNRWINFYLNGVGKDSITWNGSNIVYGNNSDYRIKTNIRSYTGGIDLVKQIQVRQYDYIETERGTDHVGFIAHELQEVIPDAVSGEKDAMRTEEETGNEVMDIQNVDYGRVTPILTAALKEAIAKIETLEARITALEGR